MKVNALSAALGAAAGLLSTVVQAQPVEPPTQSAPQPIALPPAAPAAVAQPECCLIRANSSVELEFAEPAGSKISSMGQRIKIRLAEPLVDNGQVLLPAGTPGSVEVIQVSRSGLGGKGGELSLGAPYLTLGEQRIRLKRFRYGRADGKNNSTAAMVATAVIGLPGLLISGGNIDIKVGARANAVVAADTPLTPQAPTAAEPAAAAMPTATPPVSPVPTGSN